VATLTKQQLEQLRQILQDASAAIAVASFGYEPTDDELQRLVDEGWIDPQLTEGLIDTAFRAGQLAADDPEVENATYQTVTDRLEANPVRLSEVERQAIEVAKDRAGQYCTGLGNRYIDKLGRIAIEADQALARRTRQAIKDETAQAIAERKTRKELAQALGELTEDWSRDWDRIAATELQAAHQEGFFECVMAKHGDDAMMARVPDPGACKTCLRLLTENGKPIVRPVLWWLSQGNSNAGRKQKDWKPVYGPIHPWCRCSSIRVPDGFEVTIDGSIEPVEKSMADDMRKAKKKGDAIPGGLADDRPDSDFDPKALAEGIRVEMEHTTSRRIAKEIAKDHLTEDPRYYKKLKKIEKSDRASMATDGWEQQEKPKLKWRGLTFRIENDEGDIRGWSTDDKNGFTLMQNPYGYVAGTLGTDGDEVDVFIGPDPNAKNVFVVRQMAAPDFKDVDEDKCLVGFKSRSEAVAAYLTHYDDPRFLGDVRAIPSTEFSERVKASPGHLVKALAGVGYTGPETVGRVVSGGARVDDPRSAARHVIDITQLMDIFEEAAKNKKTRLIVERYRYDNDLLNFFDVATPPQPRPKQFAEHILQGDPQHIDDARDRVDRRGDEKVKAQQVAREVQRWSQVKR
jgi:hypothetical protein